MAKGRRFVPPREREGNWFQTRGWPKSFQGAAKDTPNLTNTFPPLQRFDEKAESPYKRFLFSKHDNRHTLQDHGVYFGHGLGKRKAHERSQHYSNNMISWRMDNDQHSNYMVSYRGHSADGATHRRFPRSHSEGKPGTAPLATSTTSWFKSPEVPHRTPLHVLAVSQQPLLPSNTWAYSYRPIWS